MKNYINQTFLFVLLVVAMLMLLYHLPPLQIAGLRLRVVDVLSDVRSSSNATEAEVDANDESVTLPDMKEELLQLADTCRSGLTCIEDYGDSLPHGMTRFYKALNEVSVLDRPVRIAFFGDSFIEGDILTADLREKLQTHFGGCGVGFVPITSTINNFRPTVVHLFGRWSSHAQTDTVYFQRSMQGIAGSYFVAGNDAYVELSGQTKYARHLDSCEVATIYFGSKGVVELESVINKETLKIHRAYSEQFMQQARVEGDISSIRWTVRNARDAVFYGAAMDGHKGIAVDNFSIRGSSGTTLRGIPEKTLKQFANLRPYDLIVLQYGLNVATAQGKNYDRYKTGMLKSIEHLKSCFPDASILLLGVGDRNYRSTSGEFKTMVGVKNLIKYQQNIAAESGIAFWNMYEAMGGEGSIAQMVHAKPAMANKDYTHINFKGGQFIANLLYETLIDGKERYDRRRKYEDR